MPDTISSARERRPFISYPQEEAARRQPATKVVEAHVDPREARSVVHPSATEQGSLTAFGSGWLAGFAAGGATFQMEWPGTAVARESGSYRGQAMLPSAEVPVDLPFIVRGQTEPRREMSGITRGRLTGPVQFFAKLLEVWGLDENDGAALLGFEQVSYVRDLLSGAASLRARDAKDRIRYLFEIRAALDQLFRDEAVERDWLREARPEVGGNSPLALLLEGSMENTLLVKQFVEQISGR